MTVAIWAEEVTVDRTQPGKTAPLVTKDLSLTALRHPVRRGRLGAVQGPDGVWRSSRKAVDTYRKGRHQRRKGEEEK